MPFIYPDFDVPNINTLSLSSSSKPFSPSLGHPNYTIPIQDLPSEVLVEIFTYVAHMDPSLLLAVSAVCRCWRDVVLGSPAVWGVVVLDCRSGGGMVEMMQRRAETWIQRSNPLMLDVEIRVENKDDVFPLISPLLEHDRRWNSISICGPDAPSSPGDFVDSISVATLPTTSASSTSPSSPILGSSLDSGVYRYRPTTSPHEIRRMVIIVRGYGSVLQLDGGGGNPLGDVYFNTDCMHIVVDAIPSPHILCPLNSITFISILERSPDVHTTPGTLLRFLTACPALEQFVFMGWTNSTADRSDEKMPVVFLPRLQILRIRSTCYARDLLSHIHAPNLSELYLTYLNVDFDVHPPVGGDPEDELETLSPDFSRSPSSDRATGMGLRRLIERSNPPLQVLDMDCSDMRTRDFEFCFDRLGMLEEFSIVASDMSDSVVRMLGPETRRLPKLKALRLYDCVRIHGDVLVDVLGVRSGLTEVAIVGCDMFLPSHAHALVNRLGNDVHFTFD